MVSPKQGSDMSQLTIAPVPAPKHWLVAIMSIPMIEPFLHCSGSRQHKPGMTRTCRATQGRVPGPAFGLRPSNWTNLVCA